MEDKEKIELLEKQIELLEKVIELQKFIPCTVPVYYPLHIPYIPYNPPYYITAPYRYSSPGMYGNGTGAIC